MDAGNKNTKKLNAAFLGGGVPSLMNLLPLFFRSTWSSSVTQLHTICNMWLQNLQWHKDKSPLTTIQSLLHTLPPLYRHLQWDLTIAVLEPCSLPHLGWFSGSYWSHIHLFAHVILLTSNVLPQLSASSKSYMWFKRQFKFYLLWQDLLKQSNQHREMFPLHPYLHLSFDNHLLSPS